MKLTNNNSKLDSAIVLMFFLSGFSALIYQVLWVRMLTKYVGGSAFSISIVLTVFMGGLALGSIIASRFVDRVKEANGLILLYGLMEAVIGLCGILIPVLILFFEPLYRVLYSAFYEQFLVYNVLASLFSVVILLIPTSLMGATLPVLSRYYLQTFPQMGTRIGKLYGINTLAAALGALLSGLWMIYKFGVYGSLGIAVAINIAIAIMCVLLVGRSVRWKSILSLIPASRQNDSAKPANTKGILLILAVSGFCGMGYEVVWTRLIALLVGPTTYSFSIVLFTFITGLALGSMLFGKLCDKTTRPFTLLVFTQLGACLLALVTSHLLGSSQVFFAKLLYEFKAHFFMVEAGKSLALFAFMLPPTLMFGAAFPIATKVHTMNLKTVGKSVGSLYAANTVGALLGSFLTGFALIPFIGKTDSVSMLVIGQSLTALVVLSVYSFARRKPGAASGPNIIGLGNRSLVPALLLGVLVVILAFPFPDWNTASLARARYHRFDRVEPALKSMNFASALVNPGRLEKIVPPDDEEIVYINDGIGGFIAVGRSRNALGASNVFLSISGKTDASTRHDMSTMTLSGQIPMLFHPDPKDALVVGLASGITAGEMLRYPINKLDVLEISPEVVHACSFFKDWNNNVLADPRAKIITQDARTHLALSDSKYDVIMSEPSNPWMAGVASLFTLEYFRDVKERLKPGGIFVQWFQTYQTDWRTFSMMGGTLSQAFPNMVLMRSDTQGADFLFVCFKDDDASLSLKIAENNMKYSRRSTNMNLARPELLFPLVLSTRPQALFDKYQSHTENRPYLEYLAPRQLYSGGEDIASRVTGRGEISDDIRRGMASFNDVAVRVDFAAFMASMNVMPFNLVNQADLPEPHSERLRTIHTSYCHENMVEDYNNIIIPQYRNSCLSVHKTILKRRKEQLQADSAEKHVLARICFALADVHRTAQDYSDAALLYAEAVSHMPDFRLALKNLTASYERLGRSGEAIETLDRLLEQTPKSHTLLTRKASNQLNLDLKKAALESLERALKHKPDYVAALSAASGIHGMLGNYEKSVEYGFRALDEDPKQLRAYRNLIAALVRMDRLGQAARVAQQGLEWFPNDPMLRNVFSQTRQHIQE